MFVHRNREIRDKDTHRGRVCNIKLGAALRKTVSYLRWTWNQLNFCSFKGLVVGASTHYGWLQRLFSNYYDQAIYQRFLYTTGCTTKQSCLAISNRYSLKMAKRREWWVRDYGQKVKRNERADYGARCNMLFDN